VRKRRHQIALRRSKWKTGNTILREQRRKECEQAPDVGGVGEDTGL
jgi:hypothetical protein